MFGYLRMLRRHIPQEYQNAYKNYYCGMCLAMRRNYGQLSRFLISYDLVLIALLLKSHDEPLCNRLRCFGQRDKKQQFSSDSWKKVAAVTLLLTAGQLRDNIEDDNSLLAKVFFVIYGKKIRRAECEYPEVSAHITEGYNRLLADEKAHKCIKELSADFSMLMNNVYNCVQSGNDIAEEKNAYIKAISGWLYFIDQLDDYGKDMKKGRFNPLIKNGLTSKDYIDRNFLEIHALVQHYYQAIFNAVERMSKSGVEDKLLNYIAMNTIPFMTAIVLNQGKLPKLRHFRAGMVWSSA